MMITPTGKPRKTLRRFFVDDAGVATVDWVIICGAATAAGVLALNMSQEALTDYNADVRDEIQSPYFQTSWTQSLPIPPSEVWDTSEPITPVYEDPYEPGELYALLENGIVPNNPDGEEGNTDDGCDPSGASGCDGTSDPSGGNGDTGGTDPNGGGGGLSGPSIAAMDNASFEQIALSNGQWVSGVNGWTVQTSGSADVGSFNPTSGALDQGAITGDNVAFLYNGNSTSRAAMSQTYSDTYDATSTYQFTVDIGDGNYSFSNDQDYELNIYAGTTLIGSRTGSTGDIGTLQSVTVTSSVSNPALNGQPIRFEIVNPQGSQGDLLVDNISGQVIPNSASGAQVVTSPIQGCPDPGYIAPPVATTGTALENSTMTVNVATSGTTQINSCSGIPGWGYFTANPSITLDLSGMTADPDFEDFQVRLESSCDTTLLIRDALGNWYFDDDSGPGLNSRIRIANLAALNGQVSIWVGTYGPGACNDVDVQIRVRD